MDRNREARRAGMVASSNGISRRRHRTNSLRDSPDEDVAVEFSESVRLRERVKKDRDRDRERERDRDRERERERSSRSKRRRGDDSSQESVNDDEDEEDEDTTAHVHHQLHHSSNAGGGGGGGVRLLPPNPSAAAAAATSVTNHHHHSSSTNSHHQHHQQLQHRKTFPPSAGKPFRAAPVWKSGNEMMDVPVPRKARSVHPKRSHDWISSGSGGSCGVGDQIHRQASTSPVRQGPVSTSTPSPAPPLSPSSSNASGRRKIKANGSKQRPPPKSSSKSTSSNNPEELEIEIAEVLYGLMTQSQAPLKKEIASNDTREVNNRSCADTKSRVSSPVSGSPSPAILPSVPNSSSAAPFSAVAPKRKRPRQVSENQGSASVRSSPSSASAKAEMDQTMKAEVSSSPNFEKTPVQNGGGSLLYGLGSSINSQSDPTAEPMKVESEIKPPATEQAPESGDLVGKEEEVVVSSPKKESPPSASAEDSKAMADSVTTKPSTVSEVEEGQREEKKIQIDLMAPPPPLLRSSPEREGSATMDIKTIASESLPERAAVKHNEEDEKLEEKTMEEEKKMKAVEEAEAPPQKRTESSSSKGKDNIGVQLDLEKLQRGDNNSKLRQHHHPLLKSNNEEHPEKANQSSSFPLPPMSLAGWPGAAAAAAAGLPPMGYMAPLQGVVTMDGSSVPTPPLQPTFSQPRPKRCATHCYIARNIHLYQQFTKMNPFWLPTAAAAAASSAASLFVSKAACNLNVVPTPADLHGNIGGRGVNSGPDNKGGHGGVAIFPGLAAGGGKDKGSQPPTLPDHPAQRKQQQILLQQALPPPIAPNNLLPGHTFIFPLNQQQQQAAAATSAARPGPAKSPANAASNASNSAATGTATTGGAPAAISFSYPNMPPNETPYLAILQNNAYFPIAAVGPPLNYRATHPPSLPMFNGSFCPSQMIHHPSQLHHHHHQQQQQQQQPQQPTPSSQSQQQMQQNTSISSGSSSSHKLLQNHQQKQRSQGGGGGGVINGSSGSGNLHNFPASNSKTHPPHLPQQLPQGRHIENELGSEDNPPSTAESQGSRVPVNMYSNQNCVMPIHPSNFNLMTPPTAGVLCATSGSGNQSEKKQQQQQQGIKTGTESMQPQSFSMSFTSINGASAPGIDISSSMAQANAAIFQNFTEASRQNLHIAAAVAAAAQQPKKNYRDESRGGSGDPTTSADDERKGGSAGKGPATVGQSITFSRSDVADASGSKLAANGIDSSRSISLASASGWTARAAAIPTSMGSNAQLQAQLQHKQQQQMAQLQMQQQHHLAAAVARSKAPPTSNGIVYSEHSNPPTSVGMKFPNTISAFPQNLVQTSSNGSPVHSPQWKGSGKTSSSSQVASTTPSSLKSISHQHQQQQQQQQQQMRIQPNHTQISFVAANQKSSTTTTSQGQHPSNSNQSQSSSMVIGSPTTTSSISKGASGSPRTTSASMNNKMDHQTPLVVQQGKAAVSNPNQKSSSPASGRNVPSILGNNPHISTSSSVSKTQVQQHLAKGIQQSQLFFSSPYAQAQPSSHSVSSSSSSAPATSGYYIQTRRPEQQQPSGSTMAPTTSSTAGMLTLCPVTLGGGNTSDPAKAIAAAAAAAASNVRGGGGLPSQSILHTAQFAAAASSGSSQHQIFPAGFSYVQPPVPTVVQVKPPPEQKQPAA